MVKLLSTLLLSLSALPLSLPQILEGSIQNPPCLSAQEGASFARRWLSIWQTDSNAKSTGFGLVNVTLTENFTYYDEGASFGVPGPIWTNREEVYKIVAGPGYNLGYVTNVEYYVLFAFSSCDAVAMRWEMRSLAAHKPPNVTVPVGTPVEYKGNDYIQIDLNQRLIYNTTSSGDSLNYFLRLGDGDVTNGRLGLNAPGISHTKRARAF